MDIKKYTPALGFHFLTSFYDLTIKYLMPENKFRLKLLEELDLDSHEKILEFGFGTGQNLLIIKKAFPGITIFGPDIDPKIKEIAENKLNQNNLSVPLILYDGKSFPFENNCFDKVYSCLVFHQLSSITKIKCLIEIHRVLKPKGTLIIADWGKSQNIWMRLCFCFVQVVDGFKTTQPNVVGLMPKYIERAGFYKIKICSSINTMI